MGRAPLPTPGLTRPRLKRTIEQVSSAAGDLYLIRPGGDGDLVIEQPDDRARALLDALDGESSTGELEDRFGRPLVAATLQSLGELELLDDGGDTDGLLAG